MRGVAAVGIAPVLRGYQIHVEHLWFVLDLNSGGQPLLVVAGDATILCPYCQRRERYLEREGLFAEAWGWERVLLLGPGLVVIDDVIVGS